MKPNLNPGALSGLHGALLRQSQAEAADERVREAWLASELAERRAQREANRVAWAKHYRNLETSFLKQSVRCGAKAAKLEEVTRNGQYDT